MLVKIEGMTCEHCKKSVEKVLSQITGIESYSVDLAKGEAEITGNPELNTIIEAINKIGYKVVNIL